MNQNLLQTFRKFLEKAGTIMVHERSRKNWLIAGKQVSRRRIGRIMKQEGLISSYTTAQFKPQKTDVMNQKWQMC